MQIMYSDDGSAKQEIETRRLREDKRRSPLQVYTVENGILLPGRGREGGVLDAAGKYVEESAYACRDVRLWGKGELPFPNTEVKREKETVIFLGQLQRHWGNFLFDCIARLWYPLREKADRIVYCSADLSEEELRDPNGKYSQLFELLGIPMERLLSVTEPTRFDQILIPELAVFPGMFFSDELREVYDTAVRNLKVQKDWKGYDKLYLTRTKMEAKKELGEEAIEALFAANGYHVIAPEKLSLQEQIYLFSHCGSFAFLEGTTSHNIVFAREGAEHIILRKQSYVNTRQILFDKLKGIMPVYIDVFYEPYRGFPLSHDSGPFLVGITAHLARWAAENGFVRERGAVLRMKNKIVFGAKFVLYSVKCVYYKYVLHR